MKIIGLEATRKRKAQERESELLQVLLRDIDNRLEALDGFLSDIESGRAEISPTDKSESNGAPLSLIEAKQHAEV